MLVVDRVEGAGGEEGEVLAVQGEGRGVVLEAQRGRLAHRQVGGVGELELAQRLRAGVGPGEPGGVGREDEAGGVAVLAAVDLADLAALALDEQDPPVVRGDGDAAAVGGHGEVQHPAELPGGQAPRGGAGGEPGGGRELQGVVALGVRHPHHPFLAVGAEGARQPVAHAGRDGERAGGAGAVGDPVHPAAHRDGAAARGVVGGRGAEPVGGVDRVGLEVDAGAAEPDVQPARFRTVQVVQRPQFTGGGVDDAGAVGGGVPGVEAVERAVAAQVGAVGEGGVEGAGALVVGEEGDPVADPEGVLDVAVEVGVQPDELAVVLAVDPQLARRAAPVALPPGGLAAHRRGQQHGVRTLGDVADGPVRQGGRRSAVERDGARPAAAQAGLAVGAQGQDAAVGGPAADLGPDAAPVGEAPGGAAVDGGDVHLGGPVAGGGPGDRGAVGRDARMVHRHVVGADPPGAAAVERGEPHVVLGGEGDQLAVRVRKAEIGRRCGLSHPHTLCRGAARRQRFGSLPGRGPASVTCPRRARSARRSGTRWSG